LLVKKKWLAGFVDLQKGDEESGEKEEHRWSAKYPIGEVNI
jgi:hypothetical protein